MQKFGFIFLRLHSKKLGCHSDCKSCSGPANNECLECSTPTKVMLRGECADSCPEHFFEAGGICYGSLFVLGCVLMRFQPKIECHESCLNCITSGKSSCTTCAPQFVLWSGQCLDSCPAGTFPKGSTCADCGFPCLVCISENYCLECHHSFSLSEGLCIPTCLSGTFWDQKVQSCQKCHPACVNCTGPAKNDCTACGQGEFFADGKCYPVLCPDGKFFAQGADGSEASGCQQCHQSCRNCVGPTADDCTECVQGALTVVISNNPLKIMCKTCQELSPGFVFIAATGDAVKCTG